LILFDVTAPIIL